MNTDNESCTVYDTIPDTFTVEITKDHCDRSSGYMSITNCPLAVALKDMFPGKYFEIGGDHFSLCDERCISGQNRRDIENFKFDENQWSHKTMMKIIAGRRASVTLSVVKRIRS